MHLCCLCRAIVCSNVLAHAQKVIIVVELRFSPYFLSLAVARFADESSIFLHKSATRFIYEVHCLRPTYVLQKLELVQQASESAALLKIPACCFTKQE